MGAVKGVALAAVALVAAGLAVVYGGMVDVAASHPHASVTHWLLGTAMEKSVKRNASFISAPAHLPPPAPGAQEYEEMCALCHGAPGKPDSEVAQGLMPRPPKLARTAADWSDAELYWLIKNGVKMTGMPAWGATHSEQELWQMVSFLRVLPQLTPEQYAAMAQAGGEGGAEHRH